jgi:16S rRNA (guanine966-N2)-methyltransferase
LANKHSSKSKNTSSNQQGELRIIAGKWRGRKITFKATDGLRPSPSRIRETLFNWLNKDISSSHCLDLFAGSGALGFEALSRGAGSVAMVELNNIVTRQLKSNKEVLQAETLQIIHQDATQLQNLTALLKNKIDIVFCDPPFNKQFVQPLLQKLDDSGLLQDPALIYVETEKSLTDLPLPENWTIIKEKLAGDVRYRLIKVGER